MAFKAIRDDEGRRTSIRFEFDAERGVIRHKARGGTAREYRIELKESRFDLRPVDDSTSDRIDSP